MLSHELRLEVEDFLYHEAALLDRFALDEWVKLFTPDCQYEVPSTDLPGEASASQSLFLIADDWHRLNQRAVRLMKQSAHAEFPRSRLVHNITNIRILEHGQEEVVVGCNFTTFRTANGKTVAYVGHHHYRLRREPQGLRIRTKRSTLALDALAEQGRISIVV